VEGKVTVEGGATGGVGRGVACTIVPQDTRINDRMIEDMGRIFILFILSL
jgi:hypothetical protein